MTRPVAFAAGFVALALALAWAPAQAAVTGRAVEYHQGGTVLESYLAEDAAAPGKRPGIVVFPDWWGMTGYAKARARRLAKLGYVVLLADLYGKGVLPKTAQEAGAQVGKLDGDPALLKARYDAALARLRADPHVDRQKLVAMGYCFGAQAAFGLGRAGVDLAGIVTFHGDVRNPDPADAKNIKAHVLVFWGADDPHVPAPVMAAFENEMRATKVDWQVVIFANTVHSFTVPSAHDFAEGDAYNPIADRRSWQEMKAFLKEIL